MENKGQSYLGSACLAVIIAGYLEFETLATSSFVAYLPNWTGALIGNIAAIVFCTMAFSRVGPFSKLVAVIIAATACAMTIQIVGVIAANVIDIFYGRQA